MTGFYIGRNYITINEDEKIVTTIFPDGSKLYATPNQDGMAEKLGYDCDWELCKAHEILHTAIAVAEGKEYSRGLWRAANGLAADNADFEEENNVLKIQKL